MPESPFPPAFDGAGASTHLLKVSGPGRSLLRIVLLVKVVARTMFRVPIKLTADTCEG